MTRIDELAAIFINEEFVETCVSAAELDRLLADGWRHFGPEFFRYNLAIYDNEIRRVIPLRIRLTEFRASQSQTRVLRKNADAEVVIGPVQVTPEIEELFDLHKRRFRQHPPDSIYSFLSPDPQEVPCDMLQISVLVGVKLIAASFFDVGEKSLSGIYAVFDPEESSRSLGIFTMLKEIEYARESGKEFYYQGYSYGGDSFYNYKKRFHGAEAYHWNGVWAPFPRDGQ
jgi:arginine-tRNA-protein transferase